MSDLEKYDKIAGESLMLMLNSNKELDALILCNAMLLKASGALGIILRSGSQEGASSRDIEDAKGITEAVFEAAERAFRESLKGELSA